MTSTIPPVSETGTSPNGTAYTVAGPPQAPCVVLIHGMGLSRALWEPTLPEFAARLRVLSYDIWGHGDSAPVPEGQVASLTVYAHQVLDLLDHLDIGQAALVGFSIGGMINRRVALDAPERVSQLVILNSPHDRGPERQAAVEAQAASVRERGAFSTFDAALQRWFTPRFLAADPPALALVREWRAQADAESYAQMNWVLAHGVRELIAPDPPLTHPTLVMTGEYDVGSTPDMGRAIAAEIPGAQCQIVTDLQHLGLMEDPVAFTDPVLRFLTAGYSVT